MPRYREGMRVLPALPADAAGVYRVCLLTGDSGGDASPLHDDPDLLGHVYAGAYLAAEPALARVVVDETGVIGYVLGALDTRTLEAWCGREWWPPLRERYPIDAQRRESDSALVRLIHTPDHVPDVVVDEYPSHLHIDLLPRAQGHGVGRALMDGLLARLRDAGSPGIHLGVADSNTNAIGFYERLGFTELTSEPGARLYGLRL